MAVSFFGLLLLLLVGGGAALVVAGVVVARRGSGSGLACGKCGYATHGLTSLDCPECGSDLREVGIVRGKPKGSMAAVLITGGVVAALGLLLCGGLFTVRSTTPVPVTAPVKTGQVRSEEAKSKTARDEAIEDEGK